MLGAAVTGFIDALDRHVQVDDLGLLRTVCKKMAFLEIHRQGMADVARVRSMLAASRGSCVHWSWSASWRGSVQAHKPGQDLRLQHEAYNELWTVLKHLTHGTAHLEAQLEKEAAQRQAQRILAAFNAGQAPFNVPAAGDEPPQGRFTEEERECRRHLCRLWTAANQAVMKGNSLMSMQLLTGREVTRTHRFWRIMMKRVVWGMIQADRERPMGVCGHKSSEGSSSASLSGGADPDNAARGKKMAVNPVRDGASRPGPQTLTTSD